jgi:hypothetical protein
MPIDLNRDEDIEAQLDRLSYSQGIDIKNDVKDVLYANPNQYFTADELAARIDSAAAPVQIEGVLSNHPSEFDHGKKNGRIYWQLTDNHEM